MKWTVEQRNGRWAVVLGEAIDSTHWHTEASALVRADQLNAGRMVQLAGDIPPLDNTPKGQPFYAVLCVDGYESADGRVFDNFDWAPGPLPFMSLTTNEGGGHVGAVLAGTIETVEKLSDGRRVFATGHLLAGDRGDEVALQIRSLALRFVSVDPAEFAVEEEITKMTSTGIPLDARFRFTNYTIGGATACPFPAIRLAVVWLEGMEAPDELTMDLPTPVDHAEPEIVEVDDDFMPMMFLNASGAPSVADFSPILADDPEAMTILAGSAPARARVCELTKDCGGPALPPTEWFADPHLARLTPITVDAEGRLWGHLAPWNTPHRGFLHYDQSGNIYAPHEPDRRHFQTAQTPVKCCADASCGHPRTMLRTGPLVLATTHNHRTHLAPAEVARFYEDTGNAVADVVTGEDGHGIWVAGALRPGVDDRQVRELLGSSPSGDWRWIDGALRLVGILCVNSPGFPVLAASANFEPDGHVSSMFAGFGTVQTAPGVAPEQLLLAASVRRALAPAVSTLSTPPERAPDFDPVAVAEEIGKRYAIVDRAEFERVKGDVDMLRPLVVDALDSLIEADEPVNA